MLRIHKVGLVASASGLAALALGGFGAVAKSRISNPVGFGILGPDVPRAGAAAFVLAWVACLLLSLFAGGRPGPRWASATRGLLAAAIIVGGFWLSGVVAARVVPSAGTFARYSIGGALWLSAVFAFMLLIASRRETGIGSPLSWLMMVAVPVGLVALAITGALSSLGIAAEFRNWSTEFWTLVGLHLFYSVVAILLAIVFGVALGVLAFRVPRFAEPVFGVASVFQTIPGLAMIGLLAIPLGAISARSAIARGLGVSVLGWAPLLIALTLYALLAIVRNTYVGLQAVPAATVEAARGMGLSESQVLRRVQLPLAMPILFSGIRVSSQQTIGNATLGYFVFAATLGRIIFTGVSQTAPNLVILGSIALVTLALSVDILLRGVQRAVTPRHFRAEGRVE